MIDKKGSTVSVIWKWFGFLKSDKEQSNVRCKLCRRQVVTKSSSTANLFSTSEAKSLFGEHAGGLSLRHGIYKRPSSTSQSGDVCLKQSTLTAFMPYKQTSKRQKTSQILLCIALLRKCHQLAQSKRKVSRGLSIELTPGTCSLAVNMENVP